MSSLIVYICRERVFATCSCFAGVCEADASVQVPGEDVRGGNEEGSFDIQEVFFFELTRVKIMIVLTSFCLQVLVYLKGFDPGQRIKLARMTALWLG